MLILFTDDQRFNTIRALGNDEIRTPNLDRLVESGTAFTRAHIMGGMHGALCAPSRAMLMTGKRLFNLQEAGDYIPADHVMMPEAFAAADYETFGTGKWHNNKQAFARAFANGDNIFFGGMHFPKDGGHEAPWLFRFDSTGVYPDSLKEQAGPFSSTLFADAAIQFIKSRTESEQPFFAYVAFSSPHDPRTPPMPYADWYSASTISLPKNYAPEHPFDNGDLTVRDELLLQRPMAANAVRAELAAYYGMISEVDAQIGRILDALDSSGQLNNTIIVFAGDNGLAVGSHGLLGKQNLYEQTVRIPMVIAGPGIPRNERRDALVYQFDLFPTLAELAGVRLPVGVDGTSLAGLLRDPDAYVRRSVFYAYRDLQRGVRSDDDWKLIRYSVGDTNHVQLFNLKEDPDELNNLANDTSYAGVLFRMDSLLVAEAVNNNDPLNLVAKNWGKLPPPEPTAVDHLAVGKTVNVARPFSSSYPGGGPQGLTDGIACTPVVGASCWHGLEGDDLDLTVDLGQNLAIKEVSVRFLRDISAWIFLPDSVEVWTSPDNETWSREGVVKNADVTDADIRGVFSTMVRFEEKQTRYIRLKATSLGTCPVWHPGAGEKAWLFVDEVIVR